jgi:ClpP class serine protease
MTDKRVHAIDMVMQQPWAIQPDMLETICAIASREHESLEAVAARLGRPLQNTRSVMVRDGVAVVPVTGPIFRYANLFTEVSGAVSLEVLARDFSAALDDASIKAVILNLDSPGGQATGIAEFAHMVRAAGKPVIAYVDGMAASAAYWIASAASEIVISKTGEVGSIGAVYGAYKSKSADMIEFVSSQSPMKRPNPETEHGRAELQGRVDALAQIFIEDVAANRGVDVETVLADFGRGGVRMGEEAVRLGMADRVSTLETLIAGLSGSTQRGVTMTASNSSPEITRDYIAANHPAIAEAFRNEGYKQAVDGMEGDLAKARAEGVASGKEQERGRILAVYNTPLAKHHGVLIANLMADGKTTGPEAALAVLAAEDSHRAGKHAALRKEGEAVASVPATVARDDEGALLDESPIEDRCKAKWDTSSSLRAEFSNDFATYLAYEKAMANGQVKVLSKKD